MKPPRLDQNIIIRNGSSPCGASWPKAEMLELPERVLQFGDSTFLRAFADYFVHQSNLDGEFGGRIVAVSDDPGFVQKLNEQEGLHTVTLRGFQSGALVEKQVVSSALSRALLAKSEWPEVLEVAASPELCCVFVDLSEPENGISPEDDPKLPLALAGRITAVLARRFQKTGGSPDRGLVLLPISPASGAGDQLREAVFQMTEFWKLPPDFRNWLDSSCQFCNSVSERLMNNLSDEERAQILNDCNYEDDLLVSAELYSQWLIQGEESLRQRISFCASNPAIVIEKEISAAQDGKDSLVTAPLVVLSYLANLLDRNYLNEAVKDEQLGAFLQAMVQEEFVRIVESPEHRQPDVAEVAQSRLVKSELHLNLLAFAGVAPKQFAGLVVPRLTKYFDLFSFLPQHICFGFAIYIYFLGQISDGVVELAGEHRAEFERNYEVRFIVDGWKKIDDTYESAFETTSRLSTNESIWHTDLSALPGFVEITTKNLIQIRREKAHRALQMHLAKV